MNRLKHFAFTALIIFGFNHFVKSQITDVTWSQFNKTQQTGTTLEKVGNGKGSAKSLDILFGGYPFYNNGDFRYVADQITAGKQIGFSLYGNYQFKNAELKYSFNFRKTGEVTIVEEGIDIATFNYVIGDEFRISRTFGNMIYSINGTTVRTVMINPLENLIIEAVLIGQGTTFANVKKTFSGTPLQIFVDVNSTTREIDITPTGGVPGGYSFLWSTGETSEDITAPSDGVYSVRVSDSQGNTEVRTISLDQEVLWTNFFNSSVTNSTLIKSGGSQKWGGANGAIHMPANENGWIEYTMENPEEPRAIGFAPIGTIIKKPQDIQYGIYILTNNTVKIIENNVILLKFDYANGDIFKVERIGSTIYYYQNGVELYRTLNASVAEMELAGAISIGATLKKVRWGGDEQIFVTSTWFNGEDYGDISIAAPAGTLPYTYLLSYEPIPALIDIWNELGDSIITDSIAFFEGSVNSINYSFQGLAAERYFIAVFDHYGNKLVHEEVIVSPDIEIINNNNITTSDGFIFVHPASVSETGSGTILGLLPIAESGGFEFELESFGQFFIGFNEVTNPQAAALEDYAFGFGFISRSSIPFVYVDGVNMGNVFVRLTDKIRMLKEAGDFILFINGEEMFRAPVPASITQDLKTDLVMTKGPVIGAMAMKGKYKWPRPKLNITYVQCGETTGGINITPGALGSTIISATLTNNGSGPSFSLVSPFNNQNIPIGTYTLSCNYSVTYTTISGPVSVVYTMTAQVAIGYVVEWIIIDPLQTQIVPGTVNTIMPIYSSFSSLPDATSTAFTIPGASNWVQFESVIYSTYFSSSSMFPVRMETFALKSASPLVTAGVQTSNIGPAIIPNGVFLLNTYNTTPNAVFRIEEQNGSFSLYKDGNTSLASGTSSSGNTYFIEIIQKGKPKYVNTIASFCPLASPDQYVTPKRSLEGGYYLVPTDDVLKFEFYEEYTQTGNLKFVVRNYMGEEQSLPVLTEEFGDNRNDLDVSSLPAGFYVLEIYNDKNEKWFIRFEVQ